ncbi:ABC transporter ATP-binding protein [Holdemanella biformis]|uniref:ABC transporter ATP-binding protein n=1 Tax=Holdemanella biformis TaxID=1735 RepID=A0A413UAW2_9FIRM|nr:ABC transporter ATP-binding protein [Holdemanella biformis]RHB02387.1 ABC transporter ATP-binding protein [Holdemanella biformis]
MIKIQNLKKVYKDCVALDTVSMHIRKGEFVAIIGASGSGKTTMLNIIGGLDTDYMGSCVVRNKEMSSLSDVECCTLRSRYISYVYQFFNLISFLTVKENVCLASQIKGKKVDEKELDQVLKLLGLEHKKDCFANELSGGQQQRVAIARAILAHTDIILADEPTGNLDGENAKNVMDILKALNKEGKTIVLVTHDLKIANYADRIIRLEQGKIV